jgi:hypothetical protein
MSGIKAIAVLFLFGMALIVIGLLCVIFDNIIDQMFLPTYWVSGTAMDIVLMMWHIKAIFLLGLGILFLILGGMEARSGSEAF